LPVRLIDMDKAALQDLFDYTGFAWEQLKSAVPDDDVLVAEAPGSGWPSLRNCFGHMILAYGRWVPAIVELKSRPMPNMAPDDFLTWAQMDAHRRSTRDSLLAALERWDDAALAEQHDVNVDGEFIRYSRGELITHLLLHERGHHGDVTTLFWQLGVDAETQLEYRFHLGRD
jgi:uncharacterized damage-inducible protein DinB